MPFHPQCALPASLCGMLVEHEKKFKVTSRRRVGFELVLVFSQRPKCLYKSTKTWQRVSYCFYKITEHLTLCKNYLSKWSSSKLSRKLSNRALIQSESSTEVLTCIRGQVWIATRKYRRCSWKKLRTPENDAAEKWRESVSLPLYCQKLRVFIRWSRRNVVGQRILQTCCRRNQHFFCCGSTFRSFSRN